MDSRYSRINEYDINVVNEKVKEVIDNFNFERIRFIMNCLQWKWVTKKEKYKIPSIKKLKKTLEKLIWDGFSHLDEDNSCTTSSGGFEVYVSILEGYVVINVKFIAEEFEA